MSTFAWILAEAGAVDEGSKTAFYIGGGVLVAWAVIVSLMGISRPEFPGSAAVGRLTMLVTVVLVAGAISTSVITSS
jgi:hypothetical protein